MSRWYVLQNGQPLGPMEEAEVLSGIMEGRYRPADKVAREGSAKWEDQHLVPEFEAAFWTSPETPVTPAPAPAAQPAAQPAPPPPSVPPTVTAPPVHVHYHVAPPPTQPYIAPPQPYRDKVTAGVLALLLGWLGVHHFYLGNASRGVLYLLVSILSGGTLAAVIWVMAMVDGIIYLTKPDDQFQRNYKNWFCSGP